MEIVHVDPGYGKLMLPNADVFESVESATFNPTSGVAFTSKGSYARSFPNLDLSFDPPDTAQVYKKVWSVKLSAYGDSSGNYSVGLCTNSQSSAIHVGIQVSSGAYAWYTNVGEGTVSATQGIGSFSSEGMHNLSVTFSLRAERKTGGTEYFITNTLILDDEVKFENNTTTALPSWVGDTLNLHFSNSHKIYVSNILVGQAVYDGQGDEPSDDGIPANTPIYRLPTGTPITNFTQGDDGEWIGTENGQTLLQTTNADNLISTFGNQPVNHIVVYGNPGYRVGSTVARATGISKSGGTIEAHGTQDLNFDKTMHVYDVWEIAEGNKFSTINDLQVGWRAGE